MSPKVKGRARADSDRADNGVSHCGRAKGETTRHPDLGFRAATSLAMRGSSGRDHSVAPASNLVVKQSSRLVAAYT